MQLNKHTFQMNKPLSIFRNLYFLFFINGLVFSATFYFGIESQYEAELFNAMAKKINSDSASRINSDSFFRQSMAMANQLVTNRHIIFGDQKVHGLKANLLHSSTVDLMTGDGACGSASVILARILKAYNYQVRIAQMKVGNVWGGHIVIEVKKGEGWVLLDPLLNVYFKKSDGHFASFKEVHSNWDYYKQQLPKNYPADYNYKDVRYTNWDKYPIIGPLINKTLILFLGKAKADSICIRAYLLRNYYLLFWGAVFLLVLTVLQTGIVLWKKKR